MPGQIGKEPLHELSKDSLHVLLSHALSCSAGGHEYLIQCDRETDCCNNNDKPSHIASYAESKVTSVQAIGEERRS